MERPPTGAVYWVTGLPGVGKSTLARRLADALRGAGRSVVELDGDHIRPIVAVRLGFGAADRRAMAMIYAQLCREFSGQGHDVVCATVSMAAQARDWARAHIPDYRVIYMRASLDTLATRHPRGLVAAARTGRIRHVPGVDLAIEPPIDADVVVEDEGDRDAATIAHDVMRRLWPDGVGR